MAIVSVLAGYTQKAPATGTCRCLLSSFIGDMIKYDKLIVIFNERKINGYT